VNPATVVLLVCAFAAGVVAVLTVGMAIRDAQRAEDQFQRRIGNGVPKPEPAPELMARDAAHSLDRWFYLLVERSGTRLSVPTAMTVVAACAVVGCGLGMVLASNFLAGAAGLLLGGALPVLWWLRQQASRLKKMRKNLPGALDRMADSLHAGQTLEQAAEMVAAQTPGPLKDEFRYAVSLLRLGHSPVAVMERMARRIALPEFQVFAMAVLVHRQTGGNLAKLTSRLAAAARDRQEFFGHLGAQTVAARYSAIGLVVAAAIGVAVLAWVRPEYPKFFFENEAGPGLLVVAGAFLVAGTFWMYRVTNVKY
jgi:tight adherence protein B